MNVRLAAESVPEVLPKLLRAAYGIEVEAVARLKTVFGIVAENGMRYVWKPARPRDTERRLALLARIADRLCAAGLRAAGPLPTKAGAYRVDVADGDFGYLQPWLPGRHVRFTDVSERLTTVATLAHMHQFSGQMIELTHPLVGGPEWHTLSGGSLDTKLAEKWRVFQQVWPLACARAPELASLEEEVRSAAEGAVFSVQGTLDSSVSDTQRAEPLLRRTLCHRDAAPHNLLWSSVASPVSLIDFDHAGWDDPLCDIMQVSNHTFALCDPGVRHFADLLDVYQRICPLSAERQVLAWNLLRYPDILIRAVMEWAQGEYPEQGRKRVVDGMGKEHLRQERWREAVRKL